MHQTIASANLYVLTNPLLFPYGLLIPRVLYVSILVFKDGEIVEQGTHRELLARNGHFAKMWADQVSIVDPELVPIESGS